MVGAYAPYAQQFLLVFATATTLVFALPIFLTPLAWGRIMRFKLPSETDRAVYFGRCLGAFALIVEGLAFRAAFTEVAILFTFQVLLAVSVLMVVVHVYGAIKRIQPITETIEIALWVLFFILQLVFLPVPSSR